MVTYQLTLPITLKPQPVAGVRTLLYTEVSPFLCTFDVIQGQEVEINERSIQTNNKQKQFVNKKHCKNCCKFDFHIPVKNLSTIHFDDNELKIIQNQYKSNFNKHNLPYILDNTLVETENIIRKNNNINKELVRHKVSEIIHDHIKQQIEQPTHKNKPNNNANNNNNVNNNVYNNNNNNNNNGWIEGL